MSCRAINGELHGKLYWHAHHFFAKYLEVRNISLTLQRKPTLRKSRDRLLMMLKTDTNNKLLKTSTLWKENII